MLTLLLIATLATEPRAVPSVVAPNSADSMDARTVPLTISLFKQYLSVTKRINAIWGDSYDPDSIATARGIVRIAGPLKDTVADMIAQHRAVYELPEVASAFADAPLTPGQFAWVAWRFSEIPIMLVLVDAYRESPNEQVSNRPKDIWAFAKANEVELRAILGMPPLFEHEPIPDPPAAFVVILRPKQGKLEPLLVKEIADARSKGELPIVEITDNKVCAPCRIIDRALARPELATAFTKVRLIQISPVEWDNQILPLEFGGTMPYFYAVKANGHSEGDEVATALTQGLNFNIDGHAEENAKAVAPQFTERFNRLRTAKP